MTIEERLEKLSETVVMDITSPSMEILTTMDRHMSQMFVNDGRWHATCKAYLIVHHHVVTYDFDAAAMSLEALVKTIEELTEVFRNGAIGE